MSEFGESNIWTGIEFAVYEDEEMLADVQRLVSKDLSEPYSVYLYRYFILTWPNLCICAFSKDKKTQKRKEMIACVVSKAEMETTASDEGLQGYIAMLAVNESHRKRGLGLELVTRSIAEMAKMGCTAVYLEAEKSNKGALALYEKLGFIREERYGKYYLNGSDAFKLKLYIEANIHALMSTENNSGKEEEEQPGEEQTPDLDKLKISAK